MVNQRLIRHALMLVALTFLSSVAVNLAHEQGTAGDDLDTTALMSALGALSELA